MSRALSFGRREGMSEYVIVTGLISVCVIVGLFRFGGVIQDTLEQLKICINCDEHGNPITDDDTSTATGSEGTSGEEEPLGWWNDPSSVLYWFAQMIRWFGGAPHVYDWLTPGP